MRRAQSVRHYARPSLALASDELGSLREPGETDEDVLRKQLIEKDRLVDQLNEQIEQLHLQLSQRPPIEEITELKKEHKNLDLLLQGTQRENERCMAELEKVKTREKLLEKKLCELAGENWQSSLDIPPTSGTIGLGSRSGILGHQRSATVGSPSPMNVSTMSAFRQSPSPSRLNHSRQQDGDDSFDLSLLDPEANRQKQEALAAKLEQIKLLVMGMDQRLQTREGVLTKTVEKAENTTKKLEALRKDMPIAISAV